MDYLAKYKKILFIPAGIFSILLISFFAVYLWLVPAIVSSQRFINFADKKLMESAGVHLIADNIMLKTGFRSIVFKTDNFELIKGDETILSLKKIDSKILLTKLLSKKIIVKKLGADSIFVNVNQVLSLFPKEEKEKQELKTDWYFDFIGSILYVKDLKIIYKVNDVDFNIKTKNIEIDSRDRDKQFIRFDFSALMKKGNNLVNISMTDNDKIYITKKKIFIDETIINFNKSKLHLAGKIKDNKDFGVKVFANNFSISNIVSLIESNLVIPNGSEMLAYFDDIKGSFNFGFNITPKGIKGDIKLHKLGFILIPVENVPVNVFNGNIIVDTKNIYLNDFSGYYGTNKINTVKFSGTVKDYMKNLRVDIKADGIIGNDFAKYYLSPVIGIPLEIVGKADTKLFLTYLNNKINLKWLFRVGVNDNLLVSGEPVSKYKEERVIISDMEIQGTELRIKDLGYFVTVPGVKEFYRRKLISLHGLIDFNKRINFKMMGFKITEPVPSQFLNIIARTELFKNGTAVGELTAVDGPKGVKLFGNLKLDKIIVPSQRLFLKSVDLKTDFNTIYLTAEGGYRRSHYTVTGNMVNNIGFPMIINDIDFKLDSMDIAKLLTSFNEMGTEQVKPAENENDEDIGATFDITNLIIKKCKLRLGEATYNNIVAKNMEADVTLNEKGELKLDSNRFEFVDGHSSAHVCCHLKDNDYHVKLGVKDIDSNVIATTLLNLPKEISGKASGIMDLFTDESMKLNGSMKFVIKDGTVGKIGLIQYVLNVASVFRNPIAMINPMTVFDLVNVPEGEFDKITGSLNIKNNFVDDIKIKTYSQYLSAYIVGNYNLEKQDTSLRIYTKMTNKKKGVYGFLRNISLGNLASRVSTGARSDYNYYSREIAELPEIDADEKDCQIFMTTVDGDVEHFNFLSALKKIR